MPIARGRPRRHAPGTIAEPRTLYDPFDGAGRSTNRGRRIIIEAEKTGTSLIYKASVRYWPLDGSRTREATAQGATETAAKAAAVDGARRALRHIPGTDQLTLDSPFAALWDAWMLESGPGKAPRTRSMYKTQWEHWIGPALGARTIEQVKPGTVTAVLAAVRAGRTVQVKTKGGQFRDQGIGGLGAARTTMLLIRNLIQLADDHEVYGDRRPPRIRDTFAAERKAAEKTPRALFPWEDKALFDRLEGYVHGGSRDPRAERVPVIMALMLSNAARVSEALAARIENIWEAFPGEAKSPLVMQLAGAVKFDDNGTPYYEAWDKSRLRARTPVVLDARASRYVREQIARVGTTTGWLFPNKDGGVVDQGNLDRQLRQALKFKVGPGDVDLSWVGTHTCRRTRVTMVAMTDLEAARVLAGHSQISTTQKYVDPTMRQFLDPTGALGGRQAHVRGGGRLNAEM
ncbi:tyrosine-type recombinase/integrase [Arthrobacter sp. KK5.5]|uniref:tyrosine-type recombinase/integrase n=1 Tax=Arthrobacter sp. KK5.5 TaxID=3373084 RepID=UPI003EE6A514